MKKIAINFQDNDFINTFTGVCKFLLLSDLPETKETLVRLINEISFACYVYFQNDSKWLSDSELTRIKKYLLIEPDQVFTDSEVEKLLLEKVSNFNHSIVVLDLDLAGYEGNNPILIY